MWANIASSRPCLQRVLAVVNRAFGACLLAEGFSLQSVRRLMLTVGPQDRNGRQASCAAKLPKQKAI
jgi:hypothetical protein